MKYETLPAGMPSFVAGANSQAVPHKKMQHFPWCLKQIFAFMVPLKLFVQCVGLSAHQNWKDCVVR